MMLTVNKLEKGVKAHWWAGWLHHVKVGIEVDMTDRKLCSDEKDIAVNGINEYSIIRI